AIKKHVEEPVKVLEVDAHINDSAFAERLVKELLAMIEKPDSPEIKNIRPE
ncbi:MAG: hypothetical protein JWQ14_3432, partial [Adhaeribacter sp.]|nr:hypothetical protein [Adhaeribacter sp.]